MAKQPPVHLSVEDGYVLCNQVTITKSKQTQDESRVTCNNCKRILKQAAEKEAAEAKAETEALPLYDEAQTPVSKPEPVEVEVLPDDQAEAAPGVAKRSYPNAAGFIEEVGANAKEVCGCNLGGCEHTHQIDAPDPKMTPVVSGGKTPAPLFNQDQARDEQGFVLSLRPNASLYNNLTTCYDFFNAVFFDGLLPDCVITLHQQKNTAGYFHAERWSGKNGEEGKVKDQITINPYLFFERKSPEFETLATLLHEMCHQWRHHHVFPDGKQKPPRKSYHDHLWASKMLDLGLQPMAVDAKGNVMIDKQGRFKMTGQRVAHEPIPGGKFEKAAKWLIEKGYQIDWADSVDMNPEKTKKAGNGSNRDKYVCPNCETALWGKPGQIPFCGSCMLETAKQHGKAEDVLRIFKSFLMITEDGSNIPHNAHTHTESQAQGKDGNTQAA